MQTKTISKVISKKIEDWLSSITDISLRNEVRNDIIVTGGCITSMLLKEKPNDFDIYFRTVEICKRVADYYCRPLGASIIPYLVDSNGTFEGRLGHNYRCEDMYVHNFISSHGFWSLNNKDLESEEEKMLDEPPRGETPVPAYTPVFVTSNAITLTEDIQIITRFCGSPDKVHKNFDFTHTKMYWTRNGGVKTNVDALESVLAKRLIYSGSKFPLCSIVRTRKFIQRGWTIDAGQYVKMAIQMNGLDLLEPKTLVQQLIGVDTSYFSWLLDELTKPDNLTDEGLIDKNHAMNLINYMFDSEKGGSDNGNN